MIGIAKYSFQICAIKLIVLTGVSLWFVQTFDIGCALIFNVHNPIFRVQEKGSPKSSS